MRKAFTLAVFLFVALPVCAWSQGGRFKGIFFGEDASALPFTCKPFGLACESVYQSTWVLVWVSKDKVDYFDIIYSGESFHKKIAAHPLPTLGQAVKIHSSQPGFAKPRFGYARDRDGKVYGVVDLANRISYWVVDPASMGPESLVTRASYLQATAPVLTHSTPLADQDNAELIEAAQKMKPYTVSVTVLDEQAELKALTHDEALDKLKAQVDVVIGRGKRTLALIKSLQRWYEVDKYHPDAVAESKELRQFYPAFQEEYNKLLDIINLNDHLWRNESEPIDLLAKDPDFTDLKDEIESQMRRLKAMGFEL